MPQRRTQSFAIGDAATAEPPANAWADVGVVPVARATNPRQAMDATLPRVDGLTACCERLSYLEKVEELCVADDRVVAGRELYESFARAA